MKITKLIALIGFISVFAMSCTNDDNSDPILKERDQKELAAKFQAIGEYQFPHAGTAMPFTFTETTFSSESPTVGQESSISTLIKLFQNSEGVFRAVLKEKDGRFSALFLRNINDNSMEINIDKTFEQTNFKTEKEAIEVAYPNPKASMTNHDSGQFGWLKILKKTTSNEEINLPVNGKYVFDATAMGGGVYSYTFNNEKVTFDSGEPYEMKIEKYNSTSKRILASGLADKTGTYYVIHLTDITPTKVKIGRETKETLQEAEVAFNSSTEFNKYSEYIKEVEVPTINLPVSGKYSFDATAMGGGIYSYTFENGIVSFDAGAPYDMKVLKYHSDTQRILAEGLGEKAGSYYVIHLKDITPTKVKIGRETKETKQEAETALISSDVFNKYSEYSK